MSDDLDTFDDDLDDEPDAATDDAPKAEPAWRKKLVNKAKTATERADAAERKLAFYEAGIDPKTDKRLTFFMDGYKGELTPEAVKAAAIEAGFIETDDTGGQDAVPDAEREAHQRISGATTGGRPTGATDFDALIAEARAAGKTQRVIELKQAQSAEARSRQGR